MRAKTQMAVTDDTKVEIVLEVNIGELKSILELTSSVDAWPMGSLRKILRDSLAKANAAYFSQHEVEG